MRIIIDTGPIIGFLSEKDQHNKWSFKALGQHEPPFYTCEAVLMEAFYRLRKKTHNGVQQLSGLLGAGFIEVDYSIKNNIQRPLQLMSIYDQMDFADACIVTMTEETRNCLVLTVDYNDFSTYRRNGKDEIPFDAPYPKLK